MRYSLLIASLLVVGPASLFASVDRGLLALVPGDAKIISSIDVQQARSSQFGQYLLSKTQAQDHGFSDFVLKTGFDPRRDLQAVMFESSGPPAEGKQPHFAVLARGSFDVDRLREAAKAQGGTTQMYQGVELLVPNGKRNDTAVAFPDVGLAVMGDLATVHRILDNRANPATLDPKLQEAIDQVSNDNDAWFVSLTGGHFFRPALNGAAPEQKRQQAAQVARAIQSVTASSGGIRFGDTVDVTLDAEARSPEDATSLEDVVRFVASMVQMQRQKDPRAAIVAPVLDSMNMTSSGSSFHLTVSIPEKSLEQLAELGPPHHPRAVHAR